MAKRVDNDATQEVSASMLVPDKRPSAKPPATTLPGVGAPKNDASMWMQAPVSADDFMSAPRRKPVAPSSGGGRAVIVGLLAAALVSVAGGGIYFAFLRAPDTKPASLASPTTPSPAPGSAATATVVTDAAVAVAAADAAAAAAADAGAAAGVANLQVDAVSSADQPTKRSKKRATTKKKVVKKKTATAPKRRK